ncbi:MAG: nucleoside-diphosphate sugar epimerase [Silanimonas sp.]
MPRPPLLVFGLSGQLGDALRRRGLPTPVLAPTRSPPPDGHSGDPRIQWRHDSLATFRDAQHFDAVISLGPLDAFAQAVAEGRVRAGRIVAFGSTSVHVKSQSPDAAERDVAARLAGAEAALFAACRATGAVAVVLRPTLVWGMGRDATLSRVVRWARRWPLLPLPMGAPGLRQPVHALDLADAALAALATDPACAGAFDLPGGERLAFGAMLHRSVMAAAPACRAVPVPWRLLATAGRAHPRLRGWASRLADDLVFDGSPARETFGWMPRGFAPLPADFPP